jgi:ATP-dependent RNA helicase RhlE
LHFNKKKEIVLFKELNINTPLQNAINDLGYEYATPIQEKSYSVICSGRDVVGIAQTGTGKTIAYLLPLLRNLKYSEQRHPRVLVLVPTRELVTQVLQELEALSKYMNVRTGGVFGGANINKQAEMVMGGLDILIGTPGRLYDLMMKGVLSVKSVKKLVVDEVDEMLNLGFRPQVINIIEHLPTKRQNILYSATLTEDVEALFNEFFYNPERIEIAPHGTPLEQIEQRAYHAPNFFTKINLLEQLLKGDDSMSKVLVFSDNKKLADVLHDKISPNFEGEIGVIHSNKSQNYRFNALKQFDSGKYRVLISTDIMARGLDISDVSHVINMSLPEHPGDYLHRIGRTGRANKAGIAISFISESEQEKQMEIEELMHRTMLVEPLPVGLEISDHLLPEEQPSLSTKNYLKISSIKDSKGAYHEKKTKNKKVNLGGPGRRKPKGKKPSNRSAKKRKFKG